MSPPTIGWRAYSKVTTTAMLGYRSTTSEYIASASSAPWTDASMASKPVQTRMSFAFRRHVKHSEQHAPREDVIRATFKRPGSSGLLRLKIGLLGRILLVSTARLKNVRERRCKELCRTPGLSKRGRMDLDEAQRVDGRPEERQQEYRPDPYRRDDVGDLLGCVTTD
eukprot:scaffold69892_cov71-Phaeocystis_antarctica.AAC.2